MIVGTALLLGVSMTDFGVRSIAPLPQVTLQTLSASPPASTPTLTSAAMIAGKFGRVTSLLRSPEHNRRVGGVANSYHLSGRAIDVVRRPGISHAQLAAEFRRAGLQLVESLDEGDHSHFAFSWGTTYRPLTIPSKLAVHAAPWKIVFAPRAR